MKFLVRVGSAVVMLAVVGAALWFGGLVLSLLLSAAVLLGCWEYSRLSSKNMAPPFAWVLYPLAIWWCLHFYIRSDVASVEIGLIAGVVVGLLSVVLLQTPAVRWLTSLGGAALIGLCLSYFAGMYLWPATLAHFGLRFVVLALVGPIVGDTLAYLVGSRWGRHRFFPAISPKKSVEGAVASLLGTTVALTLLAQPLIGMAAWQGACLGVAVSVGAQGGDLAMSKLKREAGVKDSSTLIPGHGGLLDRLDSLLLVAPVVYWYSKLVGLG